MPLVEASFSSAFVAFAEPLAGWININNYFVLAGKSVIVEVVPSLGPRLRQPGPVVREWLFFLLFLFSFGFYRECSEKQSTDPTPDAATHFPCFYGAEPVRRSSQG